MNALHGLTYISRHALYHVINLTFNAPSAYTIPEPFLNPPIIFVMSSISKKSATALCTLLPRKPLQNTPN